MRRDHLERLLALSGIPTDEDARRLRQRLDAMAEPDPMDVGMDGYLDQLVRGIEP